MKKLLTVSVLAIMAVSAANADIASTGYVTDRTGDVTGAAFNGLAESEKNLTGAINAIAGRVGTTDVSAQIGTAIANAKVEDLSDGADYAKTADVVTNTELEALDGTITGEGVVTSISQKDGNVTATLKKITDAEVDSISKDKITGLGALASKNTVTQAEVDGLTSALGGKQENIGDLQNIREGAALGATSLQDGDVATAITQSGEEAGKLATSALVAEAIANSESNLSSELSDINDTLVAIPNTYATINYVNQEDDKIEAVIGSGFAAGEGNTVADQLGTVKTTADNAAKSIGEMDATYATQEGKYIASVTQADGKVTATYADLTDVAKVQVPEVCNGTATCALVWNKNTKKLDWEAIMQ